MESNCIDDEGEFEYRRTAFMSNAGGFGSLSTTITSGRSSVLNPFSSGGQ